MKEALLFGLILIIGVSACGERESQELKDKRAFIAQALRDPALAQFRNEVLQSTGWLCGEVNISNGAGSYTGFKRFIVKDADNLYLEGASSMASRQVGQQQIINNLDADIEVLQQAVELVAAGFLTASESKEWVNAQIFEKQWQTSCS